MIIVVVLVIILILLIVGAVVAWFMLNSPKYDKKEGICRGDNWDKNNWPADKGVATQKQCQSYCNSIDGCTAYDISRWPTTKYETGKYQCFLFGHDNVVGEVRDSSNETDANCYVRQKTTPN